MANSLFTGVTGLRVHQQMLDVVGNNLANSNTTGFKGQRVRFADLVYQTVNQATNSTSSEIGGTNPVQVGLGARVAATDANLQQGSLEATGRDLDLAMQGDGFFMASDGNQDYFTRVGAFGIDADNYLVDPANGYRVRRFGTVGEGTNGIDPVFQTPGNDSINIPIGTGIPGKSTATVSLQGNLSANAVGPLFQVITSATPLRSGGVPATLATPLNSLDTNLVNYIAGDSLVLQGTTHTNTAVNVTIPINATSTVADVVNAINANFPGSLAQLDASGNITVTANAVGSSGLAVSLDDSLTNTGGSSWGNHNLSITTQGKFGDTHKTGIQIYDVQGRAHNLDITFQKQANNLWTLTGAVSSSEGTMVDGLVDNIRFNDDGSFRQTSGTGLGNSTLSIQWIGVAVPQQIGFFFGSPSAFDGLTQVGGASSAVATGQNGFSAGFLDSLSISQDGVINGVFTNGKTLPVAQLAIAKFANPGALDRRGENYYALTSESGPALIGAGLAGGRGSVNQKTLESSNVDVALEFTRLIIAQRGFQVNARIITASDQVLQELANILR